MPETAFYSNGYLVEIVKTDAYGFLNSNKKFQTPEQIRV